MDMSSTKKPAYNVRYKDARGHWSNIGVAWEVEVGGKKALSLKLNLLPINWDGSALLLEPQEKEE